MADLTLTSATRKDGVVTLTGDAFTKTTTKVYVDDTETPFTWLSETQITVDSADGTTVEVTKGDVTTPAISIEEAPMGDPENPEVPTEPAPGEPNPLTTGLTADEYKTEQAKVEPAVDPAEKPIEPGQPYPTGSPKNDPEEDFFAAHGFYREKAEE